LLDGEYIVIQAPNGAYIDYIEMMANSNTKVKMTSIDTFTLDDSQPEIFDFDFTATDGDGDTVSGSFTLTAQNAPTIEGTVGGDALAGGQGNNTIYGYDGDDILVGGEGDDTLDGGPDDDTMTSGLGADTFKAAEGHDTITDYNQADGDVVDISHVIDYGAGDSLAVSENTDDGTARLSILDSSNEEKGSVSFDNIDYTDDLTGSDPTELLNSLLDQVDVDDGTT
jgi:Ca2+-binding RTX toxin-like protein